jgi:hypothetical protein
MSYRKAIFGIFKIRRVRQLPQERARGIVELVDAIANAILKSGHPEIAFVDGQRRRTFDDAGQRHRFFARSLRRHFGDLREILVRNRRRRRHAGEHKHQHPHQHKH